MFVLPFFLLKLTQQNTRSGWNQDDWKKKKKNKRTKDRWLRFGVYSSTLKARLAAITTTNSSRVSHFTQVWIHITGARTLCFTCKNHTGALLLNNATWSACIKWFSSTSLFPLGVCSPHWKTLASDIDFLLLLLNHLSFSWFTFYYPFTKQFFPTVNQISTKCNFLVITFCNSSNYTAEFDCKKARTGKLQSLFPKTFIRFNFKKNEISATTSLNLDKPATILFFCRSLSAVLGHKSICSSLGGRDELSSEHWVTIGTCIQQCFITTKMDQWSRNLGFKANQANVNKDKNKYGAKTLVWTETAFIWKAHYLSKNEEMLMWPFVFGHDRHCCTNFCFKN